MTHRNQSNVVEDVSIASTMYSGFNVDFTLLGVMGLGMHEDKLKIRQAIESNEPYDAVFVGICPTRLSLVSYEKYGSRQTSNRSYCGSFLLFMLWRRISERLPTLCGYPHISPKVVYSDLNEAVLVAAEKDIRVVFGDRDFLKILGRAWDKLSFFNKVSVLLELIVCSVLPISMSIACFVGKLINDDSISSGEDNIELMAGDEERQSSRVSPPREELDALSAMLRHMSHRYPSLQPLVTEQDEYTFGTLDRLDVPLEKLCPSLKQVGGAPKPRRGRVLVISGVRATRQIVQWFEHDREHLNSDQVALKRKDASRTSATTTTPSFLVPLLVVLVLVGLPVLYAALFLHEFLHGFLTSLIRN